MQKRGLSITPQAYADMMTLLSYENRTHTMVELYHSAAKVCMLLIELYITE